MLLELFVNHLKVKNVLLKVSGEILIVEQHTRYFIINNLVVWINFCNFAKTTHTRY